MRTPNKRAGRPLSDGYSVLELMIVVALFSVIVLTSMALVDSGRRFSTSTIEITAVEDLSQRMLFRLEHELANAAGREPEATVVVNFGAGDTDQLTVTSTDGFPPTGTLLLQRGSAWEERIDYDILDADQTRFRALTRARECTEPSAHLAGPDTDVMWAGLAVPLESQFNPPASEFDGIANEDGQPVFFRGDGTGFSYRVPVDPTGGRYYLDGDDLFWGAEVRGAGQTLEGRMALYFLPKLEFVEAETGDDLNGDGDTADVFDVGQIRRITWDVTNPDLVTEVGMGPSAILQERCNRGGDLDADGFDDPIFLWDPESNLLHVRLFVLGMSNKEFPIVRSVESVMFLRNEPEIE